MASIATDNQIRTLRAGDRLTHRGSPWQVQDYSTYTDGLKGYRMEEWRLHSPDAYYYLLREADKADPDGQANWYLAEELKQPVVTQPGQLEDLRPQLAAAMQNNATPYPTLQVAPRTYQFESRTEGTLRSGADRANRVTWDYWDQGHTWNLGLEAWEDGTLVVYSTRSVKPSEFSAIERANEAAVNQQVNKDPTLHQFQQWLKTRQAYQIQLGLAVGLLLLGVVLWFMGV
jgi:Domain of unknown function (DUF4178)